MRDMLSNINPRRALSPVAATTDNTAYVSQIIDVQGFDSLTFLIATGSLADADATFAVTMDHGDQSNLSDAAAVPAAQIAGTLALAGFTFAADDSTRKVGYLGDKRYVRLTITPANNTGNVFIAAIALLGHPHQAPTSNPPA